MSSHKCGSYDDIEQDFLDALKRIEDGKPKHKALKAMAKEGRLKITISNVALEAGRARTLIGLNNCRYPKVRETVQLAIGGRRTEPRTHKQLVENLRAQLAEAKLDNKFLQDRISDYFLASKTAEEKTEALAETNARLHKEIASLSKHEHMVEKPDHHSPRLVLIRGLPGSGKTTRARTFKENGYEHIEADMFFESEGQYLFDPDKIFEAHAWCLQKTHDTLKKGCHVVVANVFASIEDIKPYTTLGFTYDIVEATGKNTSIHNVPVSVLRRMKAAWVPTKILRESLTSPSKVSPLRRTKGKKLK